MVAWEIVAMMGLADAGWEPGARYVSNSSTHKFSVTALVLVTKRRNSVTVRPTTGDRGAF